eukprot:6214004-Amphidinium_carterae.4
MLSKHRGKGNKGQSVEWAKELENLGTSSTITTTTTIPREQARKESNDNRSTTSATTVPTTTAIATQRLSCHNTQQKTPHDRINNHNY